MPRRHPVVIVQEMNETAAGIRPAQVTHHAGHATGRVAISQVTDPPIAQVLNHRRRAAIRTVVDDHDFQRDAGLRKDIFFSDDSAGARCCAAACGSSSAAAHSFVARLSSFMVTSRRLISCRLAGLDYPNFRNGQFPDGFLAIWRILVEYTFAQHPAANEPGATQEGI